MSLRERRMLYGPLDDQLWPAPGAPDAGVLAFAGAACDPGAVCDVAVGATVHVYVFDPMADLWVWDGERAWEGTVPLLKLAACLNSRVNW
jgi:hypothetical protein